MGTERYLMTIVFPSNPMFTFSNWFSSLTMLSMPEWLSNSRFPNP